MKATKLFTTYGKYANSVTYEYRGHQYDVEYANDWTYCVTPARIQHENAQQKIDKQIEQELKMQEEEQQPIDLDEIWKLLDWD